MTSNDYHFDTFPSLNKHKLWLSMMINGHWCLSYSWKTNFPSLNWKTAFSHPKSNGAADCIADNSSCRLDMSFCNASLRINWAVAAKPTSGWWWVCGFYILLALDWGLIHKSRTGNAVLNQPGFQGMIFWDFEQCPTCLETLSQVSFCDSSNNP